MVPYEDADASVAEIRRWAGHSDMVQVLLLSRTVEPLGHRRYWPIYRAAAEAGLPLGIHAFGNGGTPTTGTGWPSFYMEDMIGHSQSCQSMLSSMVLEGVFAHVPALRVVLIARPASPGCRRWRGGWTAPGGGCAARRRP